MSKRSYVSPVRRAGAAETRDRLIKAAIRLLREETSISDFSLDRVAKAAGVTRLTVYRQFGSRRGLLEEVFDDIAWRGGLTGISDAMAMQDAHLALDRMVEIFCGFWNSDPAVGRLHDAMAIDPEFAQALVLRNERRRGALAELVARLPGNRRAHRTRNDAIDLIFVITSYMTFASLSQERSVDEVCILLKSACRQMLDAALSHDERSNGSSRRRSIA
jgi:AcrR family transcriptional regulator